MQTKITFAGGVDRPRHVQPREHAPVVGRQRLRGELQPHLLQGGLGDARRVPVRRPQRTDRRGRARHPGRRRGVRGRASSTRSTTTYATTPTACGPPRRRTRRPYTLFSTAIRPTRVRASRTSRCGRSSARATFAAALQQHPARLPAGQHHRAAARGRASARSCRTARAACQPRARPVLHAVVRHRLSDRRRREQAADHRARARRRRIHLPPVNYWGASHTAMTAYWTAAAAITRVWKSSWYPNTAGAGSGRLTAYTTAPNV